jgi:hypothetical protein
MTTARARCILILFATVFCGCKSSTEAPPAPRPVVKVNGQDYAQTGAQKPVAIDEALKSDPCAARMHAISGAMLEYYALHNRLPRALTELQSLADLDEALNFNCPETGTAYTYVPAGLQTPSEARHIILHDATSHSSGQRWTILLQKPKARQPAAMWVVPMSETVFRSYTPTPATTHPTLPK